MQMMLCSEIKSCDEIEKIHDYSSEQSVYVVVFALCVCFTCFIRGFM